MAEIKFGQDYAYEFEEQVRVNKDGEITPHGICGEMHTQEELDACPECIRVKKVVEYKMDGAIAYIWNKMGQAQIDYKEEVELKLAQEKKNG